MEAKKSYRKDLERLKNIFLQIGMIVAFSFVFIAFEWTTEKINIIFVPDRVDGIDLIELPPIVIDKPEEAAIEKPKPPRFVDIITISEDPFFDDSGIDFVDIEEYQHTTYEPVELDEEIREDITVYDLVDKMPEFPGGEQALLRYLANEIKYPALAEQLQIFGKVYVSFVINKEGYVTNVKIARSADPALEKEAIRVVSSMPRWEPGLNKNKPVNVSFVVPINFVLK